MGPRGLAFLSNTTKGIPHSRERINAEPDRLVGPIGPSGRHNAPNPVLAGLPVATWGQHTQLVERRVNDAVDPGFERHRHDLDHGRVVADLKHAAACASGCRLDRHGQLDWVADAMRVDDGHRRSILRCGIRGHQPWRRARVRVVPRDQHARGALNERDRRGAARMRYMDAIAMARLRSLARGRSAERVTSEPRDTIYGFCERHHHPPNRVLDEFENGNGDLAMTKREWKSLFAGHSGG